MIAKKVPRSSQKQLLSRLAPVRLLLCDVDGVLTDGTVVIGNGLEYKRFNIQDGLGMVLLRKHGVKVGWISNRPSPVTEQRATELRIDYLHQGKGSKITAAEDILSKAGISWPQVCYMGDDVVDLAPMHRAGVGVAVANAIEEAKKIADYITTSRGGEGAVREVVALILKAQNKWGAIVRGFAENEISA